MTLLAETDRRRREVGSPARVEDALLTLAGFTWLPDMGCYVDEDGAGYDRWTALDEACARTERDAR